MSVAAMGGCGCRFVVGMCWDVGVEVRVGVGFMGRGLSSWVGGWAIVGVFDGEDSGLGGVWAWRVGGGWGRELRVRDGDGDCGGWCWDGFGVRFGGWRVDLGDLEGYVCV